MSETDKYLYTLTSCNPGSYPSFHKRATAVSPSPFSGLVVYIDQIYQGQGISQGRIYTLDPMTPPADGLNAATMVDWLPTLGAANLVNCADPNNDKMYRVHNCVNVKETRDVLFAAAQNIGDVVNFTGECTCWTIQELLSTYIETLPVAATYPAFGCDECLGTVAANICTYGERTLGYAIKAQDLAAEPPDRGFGGCCSQALVLGDLSDPNNAYHNDFFSVYFQKQTDSDTVAYQIIPVSTGVPVNLVDGTHGTLWDFDTAHTNPDLSYFRVSWHDILNTLGADQYTIRMQIATAGLPTQNVDTPMVFHLKPWGINNANGTVRMDVAMDGTLEKEGINFKDSGFDTSMRAKGFFGNPSDDATQNTVVYSSRNGVKMYESQITMNNNPSYPFQMTNIHECISRYIRKFYIFANDIYISDYNKNNHSYEYELTPVALDGMDEIEYHEDRSATINMTFKDRSKNNRKTNC